MKENKRTCKTCGRIITDPGNKTGLCPKCQKTANSIVGVGSIVVIAASVKKFGPKIAKGAFNLLKK